ncbi:MAG: MBL fold metallo-hydrolase [Patescibacteria group bacterium]
MSAKASITFCGGTGSVTGANFLLETEEGGEKHRILVDCGLEQSGKVCPESNFAPFTYDPASVEALFVTHGHLDHVGRIGKLVKDGFKGKIYSTPPTKDIAELIMLDSLGVMEKERRGTALPPLYEPADVEDAMQLWQTFTYHDPVELGGLQAVFRDAGHILGSSMVEFTLAGKKILFSGDLGNSPMPLLPDTEKITDIDYLLMESVYGDRNHERKEERAEIMKGVIKDTMKAGGTLMIPAFSVERTQELLFEIENMMENSEIPLVPVFVDSPLAIQVTEVYKKYHEYFKKDVGVTVRASDGQIFKFPQLHFTRTTEESKTINYQSARKIVIAGSGMSNGGRILHHEKHYLPDPNSTLLLAGYQAAGSLGRIIQDGAKHVRIMGEDVAVRAKIALVSGYSGHKDSDGLLDFAEDSAKTLKKVFVVMGEPKSSLFLVQRLRDYIGLDAVAPETGEKIKISI